MYKLPLLQLFVVLLTLITKSYGMEASLRGAEERSTQHAVAGTVGPLAAQPSSSSVPDVLLNSIDKQYSNAASSPAGVRSATSLLDGIGESDKLPQFSGEALPHEQPSSSSSSSSSVATAEPPSNKGPDLSKDGIYYGSYFDAPTPADPPLSKQRSSPSDLSKDAIYFGAPDSDTNTFAAASNGHIAMPAVSSAEVQDSNAAFKMAMEKWEARQQREAQERKTQQVYVKWRARQQREAEQEAARQKSEAEQFYLKAIKVREKDQMTDVQQYRTARATEHPPFAEGHYGAQKKWRFTCQRGFGRTWRQS